VEELRIIHSETVSPDSPYAEAMHPDHHHETADAPPSPTSTELKDPYGPPGPGAPMEAPAASDAKQGIPADLKNPYAASEARARAKPPPRPSSELILELPPAFEGVILVDGLAAPFLGRTGFPLPPGHHTVSVFPKGGHPYQLPLFVRPDRTERLPIP
jgi:hypothetical protein